MTIEGCLLGAAGGRQPGYHAAHVATGYGRVRVSVVFLVTLAALGFVGAFASGLVGVGGAIVMIPLLLYVPPLLGVGSLDIKTVAGVTMAQVLAASLMGAWTHGRRAMLHRRLALWGGAAMAVGSLTGAVGSHFVGHRVLLLVFALMATAALLLMFISPVEPGHTAGAGTMSFNRAEAVGIPGVVGLVSGLVGAGGAFLLTPVLIGFMRVPVRLSIGTSLAIAGAGALLGFMGKLATGQVPFVAAAAVVVGSLPGAGLGARLSRRAPVDVLRVILGILIALAALRVWLDVLEIY
jgi:uncharacterized membrane protein YfcA